ncbi:MAG: hypothetical protein LLG37_10210 [Spirochaetia bacterium]|nr:hypothetical protein [Spirochaetia bacterium]
MKRMIMSVFILISAGIAYAGDYPDQIKFAGQTLGLVCTKTAGVNFTAEFIPPGQRISKTNSKITIVYYPSVTLTAVEKTTAIKTEIDGRIKSGDPVAMANVMNLDYSHNREAVIYVTRSYNNFSVYEKSIIYLGNTANGIMTVEFSRRYNVKKQNDPGVNDFQEDFFKAEDGYLSELRTTKWPLPEKEKETGTSRDVP